MVFEFLKSDIPVRSYGLLCSLKICDFEKYKTEKTASKVTCLGSVHKYFGRGGVGKVGTLDLINFLIPPFIGSNFFDPPYLRSIFCLIPPSRHNDKRRQNYLYYIIINIHHYNDKYLHTILL